MLSEFVKTFKNGLKVYFEFVLKELREGFEEFWRVER